jgi:hypothetical protein
MHIDFHHAVTYIIARTAGFDHREADIIAYSSQYVDDATNSGTIMFDNRAMYTRTCSAHKMLDSRNFEDRENHHVWIPFHFLPGNGGLPCTQNPRGTFIEKIVCSPDSDVARDMIRACIADRDAPYALHRLGITMHVYADTWAHQGFTGVKHMINSVLVLDDVDKPANSPWKRFKERAKDLWYGIMSKIMKSGLPLGHGCALTYPDLPYLEWHYKDHEGNKVQRNNPQDFLAAADAMCRAMQCYRAGSAEEPVAGLPEEVRRKIGEMLHRLTDEDAVRRHTKWLEAIAQGTFGFMTEKLNYQDKGPGSWKHKALGTVEAFDEGNETFPYHEEFLKSDWKMFHDALQAHRFTVIYDILPKYGICAA